MIITSGKYSRSIYSQSSCVFELETTFPNSRLDKVSSFGLSGSGGYLNLFKFSGGKIVDHNDKYVWHYNPNEKVEISGNINSDNLNYFINKNPICIFSPKANQGFYDYALIQTDHDELDINLNIYGETPSYSFNFPTEVFSDQNLTGYIINNSSEVQQSFEIFSGRSISNSYSYELTGYPLNRISGLKSGALTFDVFQTFLPDPITNKITFTLNTNFGDIRGSFDFLIKPVPVYFTDLVTTLTGIFNDKPPFSKQYIFDLKSIYPSDRNFTISLSYVSGFTGIVSGNIESSGVASGVLSGFVHGYDFISGIVSGTGVYTGIDGSRQTGEFNPTVELFTQYATGDIIYNYNLPARSEKLFVYAPPPQFVSPFSGVGIVKVGFENPNLFIIGEQDTFVSGLADIKGVYNGLENISYNATGISYGRQFYTGDFLIDYETTLWDAYLLTGSGFSGAASSLFISGNSFEILSSNPALADYSSGGKVITDYYLYNSFKTAKKLESLVSQKPGFVSGFSGIVNSSTGVIGARGAFFNDGYIPIYTDTGFISYEFFNYSPSDLKSFTHYGFNVDLLSDKYPSQFVIETFNNSTQAWDIKDYRSGVSFYPTGSRWFALNSPIQSPSRCRLRIISGEKWPHFTNLIYSNFDSRKKDYIYGIKALDLYSSIDVYRQNPDGSSEYNLSFVDTGISDYEVKDIPIEKQPYVSSGIVLYSSDDFVNPAWYCFNSNKQLYPSSAIYGNGKFQEFLGFSGVRLTNNGLNSYVIEFTNNNIPKYFSIYQINANQQLELVHEKYNPSIIESGKIKTSNNIYGLVYSFNELPLDLYGSGFVGLLLDYNYKDTTIDQQISFYKEQEIFPSGRSYGLELSYFGYNFDISSNGKFLAAASSDKYMNGGVYIYSENLAGFAFQRFLTGVQGGEFGYSLSLNKDGTFLAVAEPNGSNGNGAAYIYSRAGNHWNLSQYISGTNLNEGFGRYVKLSDDASILAISSKDDDYNADGKVWIYKKASTQNTWSLISEFVGQLGTQANAGASIEINYDNSLIFIGAPNDVEYSYLTSSSSSPTDPNQNINNPQAVSFWIGVY